MQIAKRGLASLIPFTISNLISINYHTELMTSTSILALFLFLTIRIKEPLDPLKAFTKYPDI